MNYRRHGDLGNGLDGLHGPECEGNEYTTVRPVSTGKDRLAIVFMAWCGECGAAFAEDLEMNG